MFFFLWFRCKLASNEINIYRLTFIRPIQICERIFEFTDCEGQKIQHIFSILMNNFSISRFCCLAKRIFFFQILCLFNKIFTSKLSITGNNGMNIISSVYRIVSFFLRFIYLLLEIASQLYDRRRLIQNTCRQILFKLNSRNCCNYEINRYRLVI